MKLILVKFRSIIWSSMLTVVFAMSMCTTKTDPVPAPNASFSYTPNSNLTAPITISFTNTSTNADSYLWTYGNGQTDTDEDLTLQISTGGTYTITLKAIGKGGSDTYSRTISVENPTVVTPPATQPTADFTFSPSSNLTAPIKITFTNTSKNASSYKWDFGDGTTSVETNPTKEYNRAGNYEVKLTATDTRSQSTQKSTIISVKGAAAPPTTSNINPFRYLARHATSLQSKELTARSFRITRPTPVVIMNTSRYASQAGLMTADEYAKFINNGAFQGWGVFDKQNGYEFLTLDPGTYYVGVRDASGNSKENYYCYQVYYATQIPESDRCEFVDIYIKDLKTLQAGEYLYHKFTIQEGFRYVFNGGYSSWNLRGYFIPESELANFTSGRTFQSYTDYVAGADGTLAVEELKLPAGNYYFVFKNTLTKLPLNITYFMERYRRL
ncbi:PKD domain-containing protein [Spirosoma soli]|uniref:PKD domain-containing protein n=1 Tax=Spirosoma soli TaxID=1770529 RepID=A0ABW5M2S5_9BACT